LRRMTYVLGELCVYPENMKRNLEKSGGAVFSEPVLLALVDKGVPRDEAYRMVQRHALKIARDGGELKDELLKDPEITSYLSPRDIEAVWGLKHHLAHVDFIFRRVFHKNSSRRRPAEGANASQNLRVAKERRARSAR
jgi:adenylosuccinate lyase